MKALQQVHAGQSVVRLNLHGTSALPPTEHANLRILAITAGVGNGWHFSAASLRNSLPHWEGVHTFVDHAPLAHRAACATWPGSVMPRNGTRSIKALC